MFVHRHGNDDPLLPRPPAGMKAGSALAVLVHLLLIGALALGLNWRVRQPEGVDAELWAAVPQVAAPRAAAPEPAREVKPPAPPPEPKAKIEPAPPTRQEADAQIAIEKAKRGREREEKEEKAERLAKDKADATRRAEAEKKAAREAAAKEAAQLAEKRRKDEADQRKAAEAESALQEAQRNERLKRIMREAGAGADTATGTAAQTAGPSAGYAGRIKARVKPNIVYAETPSGNPVAEVELRLAPDGRIVSQKLLRSSGLKDWDDAVLRAVERTEMLPRDIDGRVPTPIVISFRPRD